MEKRVEPYGISEKHGENNSVDMPGYRYTGISEIRESGASLDGF